MQGIRLLVENDTHNLFSYEWISMLDPKGMIRCNVNSKIKYEEVSDLFFIRQSSVNFVSYDWNV